MHEGSRFERSQTLRTTWLIALVVLLLVTSTSPAVAQAPPSGDAARLAIKGLDPVALLGGKEVAGDPAIQVRHGAFVYQFANAENRARFEAEPERFAFQLGGHCAVMPRAAANPDLFAVHEGRLYGFGSPGCRTSFLADPAAYKPGTIRNVAILLFNGVELLDFAGPGEVFAAARMGRDFNVFTVAPSQQPIESQGFVQVTPEFSFANSPKIDVLVVPGGGVGSLLDDPKAMAWIEKTGATAEVVLSVCNGALVLAYAGLLDGLEATTHHGSLETLREWAPKTVVHADRRFVDNGKVITAAGVSAGIDASLHLVERLSGQEVAVATARYMEYTWTAGAQVKAAAAR